MCVVKSLLCLIMICASSAQPPLIAGGANPPPPPPPPGRGFQLKCSDQYAYMDVCDPVLFQQITQNGPLGYRVVSVDPSVHPGKNAHRYLVKYTSNTFRRCEDIARVRHEMNTFKPQNSNVGSICVVPGGYLVEYKQFCMCYRRGYRRRRETDWWDITGQQLVGLYISAPQVDSAGNVASCNDRDLTCGHQHF